MGVMQEQPYLPNPLDTRGRSQSGRQHGAHISENHSEGKLMGRAPTL